MRRYAHLILNKLTITEPLGAAIISSTATIPASLLECLKNIPQYILLDYTTPCPVKNRYKNPASLGMDRLAAAVGARKLFPDQACLIIDTGTCITMNYLSAAGEFLGGNISPGIKMRLKAMHTFTARLPLAEINLPEDYFATNTIQAMQNGAVKGAFREIDSFIEETIIKYGTINVILTGGDAYMFESYTKNKIFVAPNLVLEGLNEILKYNVK